jgi:hypothetical protein
VRDARAILRLLVILATRSDGARVPFDGVVAFVALKILREPDHRTQYSNGNRRRMYATAPFGKRDSLDAVTAGFVLQLVCVVAVDFECEKLVTAALIGNAISAVISTLPGGEFDVGFGQLRDEQLRVKAAFGCSDFKDS